MIGFRGLSTLATVLLFACPASAIELNGAWASDADLCGKVFSKQGNQVVFSEMSELYGSGFIIDGNHIRGKSAKCAIKSQKENGNEIEISAACASTIMTQDYKFIAKVIDNNNINRIFPDISGMSVKYTRCPS